MRRLIDLFYLVLLSVISVFGQNYSKEIEINGNKFENNSNSAVYINQKSNGFKGIWYMVKPTTDEYGYKYSGGMATYCEEHRPFAIYAKGVNKTFFCFGGTDDTNSTLLHNVSYFDHKTGRIANPLTILDKRTNDAHDNPVISIDNQGYIYIFSTSHGKERPSYISKSEKPYSIEKFNELQPTEIVNGKVVPFKNFSYFQVWFVKNKGFFAIFTKYNDKGNRVIGYNTSKNAITWNEWKVIAHIEEGHYQICQESNAKIGSAFNYHPNKNGQGFDYRTNLYYVETIDFGKTWHNAAGKIVQLPLKEINNDAKVKDFKTENLNCYIKDIAFDKNNNPVIMVVSSKGFAAGPANNPRTWELFSYDKGWKNCKITTSNNNYDTGSLFINTQNEWEVYAPTEMGPQPYNPGGEMVCWKSIDSGKTWNIKNKMTSKSEMNQNYLRGVVNGKNDFFGIWADGNGRKPSVSHIYFCNKNGDVFQLPRETTEDMILPLKYTNHLLKLK